MHRYSHRSQPNPLNYQAVGDMELPAQNILQDMETKNHRISRGHYRLVVGDDASGRLFGHIFASVISRLHGLYGHPRVPLVFSVGHPKVSDSFQKKMTDLTKQRLRKMLEANQLPGIPRPLPRPLKPGLIHPQVLVATDAIQSGSSLIPAVTACRTEDIGIEAAAIQQFHENYKPWLNLGDTTLYDGKGQRTIYQQYHLLGVRKELAKDTVARPFRGDGTTSSVRMARQDVGIISDRLVDWFTKKFKPKK